MRIGLIGCGKIARSVHIPALLKMRGIELVAFCDNNEFVVKEIAKIFNLDRGYSDVDEMLTKEDLDVIDVCTPPQTHAAVSIQAMEAGCHVLLEKPFASNIEEAERIIATSKKSGVKLCVIHNYLFKPVVMKAKSIIEKGNIGNLLSMNVNFLDRPDVEFMDKNHWSHNLIGGRFGENIIHPLYLIDEFMGITDLIAVQAAKLGNCDWVALDELRVLLKTRRSIGAITLSANAPKNHNAIDIYGTRGILHIDLMLPGIFNNKAKRDTVFYPVGDYINNGFKCLINAFIAPPKWIISKNYIRSGHYYAIQKFIESIREDKMPPVTAEKAKKMLVLQEKIFDQIKDIG